MKRFVNLTPHAIKYIGAGASAGITIPASGTVARVDCAQIPNSAIEYGDIKIPVLKNEYGEIQGLPAPVADTIYIVSALVKSRCPDRDDVIYPTNFVRDNAGKISGCKAFAL